MMLSGPIRTLAAFALAASFAGPAQAADAFVEGKNYFLVEPPQATSTGDKVEVLEVFSYACPACNAFQPTMHKIAQALPANAALAYLPASFRPDEDWPVFQRTFYAAQALGVHDKTHDAVFDLVWKDDGPLRISDAKTHRPVKPMPTIDDVAKAFTRFGVNADEFVGTANSFAVNAKMKRADAQLKALGVDSTPSIVVAGKYRFTVASAGGLDQLVPLIQFLVAKESAGH
jgi:thiol:disulfide interchange protein DsbA